MKIPEKEQLFNRFYYSDMSKEELTELGKRMLVDKELLEWFTLQMEVIDLLREPPRLA